MAPPEPAESFTNQLEFHTLIHHPTIIHTCVHACTSIMYCRKVNYSEKCIKNHLTGRLCLIIPDLAAAILSKEPPSAARCSAPTFVMIETARPELVITLVASRAPPNPAYIPYHDKYHHHFVVSKPVNYNTKEYKTLKYINQQEA